MRYSHTTYELAGRLPSMRYAQICDVFFLCAVAQNLRTSTQTVECMVGKTPPPKTLAWYLYAHAHASVRLRLWTNFTQARLNYWRPKPEMFLRLGITFAFTQVWVSVHMQCTGKTAPVLIASTPDHNEHNTSEKWFFSTIQFRSKK